MLHIFEYDVNADERFQKTLDTQYVDLLDKHGFPLVPEQPKNVHDLGRALGGEYNSYIDQAKVLFISSKLSIAQGEDLDIFGLQFGVPRNTGEEDDSYRLRLQAVFSPKKVTRPHIEAVLNQFADINASLFEPWREVIHFDVDFPYDYRFDTGPWKMWSPDYWRSGVLVVKSDLTDRIYGVVDSLINAGIVVWYEQFFTAKSNEPEFIPETESAQVDDSVQRTFVFERFFFDLFEPGYIDDPLSRMDVGDFTLSPSGQEDTITSQTYFSFSNCFTIPILPTGIWDEGEWDFAQWQDNTGGITAAHQEVLNNPWMEFDTIDPGAFLSNENAFQFDFVSSADFDINPNNAAFDNTAVVVNNDHNKLDSTVFVITGWIPVDKCKEGSIKLDDVTACWTDIPLTVEQQPGEYLAIEGWEFPDDTFELTDLVTDIYETLETTEDLFNFLDRANLHEEVTIFDVISFGTTTEEALEYDDVTSSTFEFIDNGNIIYEDVVSDVVSFDDTPVEIVEWVESTSVTLEFNDSVEADQFSSAFTLGDEVTLGESKTLGTLPNINLANNNNITLEGFKIE